MKSRVPMVAAALFLLGCNRTGEEYVCWDVKAEEYVDATAQLSLLTGELKGFEATDRNGLRVTVDEENSQSYECISRAELDEQNAERERQLDQTCPSVLAQADNDTSDFKRTYSHAMKRAECEEHLKSKKTD